VTSLPSSSVHASTAEEKTLELKRTCRPPSEQFSRNSRRAEFVPPVEPEGEKYQARNSNVVPGRASRHALRPLATTEPLLVRIRREPESGASSKSTTPDQLTSAFGGSVRLQFSIENAVSNEPLGTSGGCAAAAGARTATHTRDSRIGRGGRAMGPLVRDAPVSHDSLARVDRDVRRTGATAQPQP